MAKTNSEITIQANTEGLDTAIEKANQLLETLKEAQKISDSLSGDSTSHIASVGEITEAVKKSIVNEIKQSIRDENCY